MLVFIVETHIDSYLFDENLQIPEGDHFEASAVITFQQEVLAPNEDWESWGSNLSEEEFIDKIRELVKPIKLMTCQPKQLW